MNKHEEYGRQVQLLLRVMPLVYKIKDFAVHGGTAINLFYRNMPRYSVDIDVTYIPVSGRDESVRAINKHLADLKRSIETSVPGVRVLHKQDVLKLVCTSGGVAVKIEVNGTKRGLIGEPEVRNLCEAAREEFQMAVKCRTVSFSQLFGGKVSAALSRQHPRDLFDCRYLIDEVPFGDLRDGLLFCLAGSDKPIVESICPNEIDQREALENQFAGMSDVAFTYDEYERTRVDLLRYVREGLSDADRRFLVSFEAGEPNWSLCSAGNLSRFPSVRWKLMNLKRLADLNPAKFRENVERLQMALQEKVKC